MHKTLTLHTFPTCFLPTLALRNLLPILWSMPIALATSSTSAPVDSHRALMLLMLLIRCARNALAACTNHQIILAPTHDTMCSPLPVLPGDFRPNVSGVARCQPYTHQFGKLRRPRVGGDDSFFGDPVFVDGAQRSDGPLTFRGFISTNQDTVWLLQVPNSCSLCEELWVGQNLKKWHDVRILAEQHVRVSFLGSGTHM